MLAGRVDDHDLDVDRRSISRAELADEEIGGEGAPHTPTQDEDPLHRRAYRSFSTMIVVVAVASLEGDQAMPGLLDPLGDVRLRARVRRVDGDDVADLALADGPDELHQRARAEAAARVDDAGDGDVGLDHGDHALPR